VRPSAIVAGKSSRSNDGDLALAIRRFPAALGPYGTLKLLARERARDRDPLPAVMHDRRKPLRERRVARPPRVEDCMAGLKITIWSAVHAREGDANTAFCRGFEFRPHDSNSGADIPTLAPRLGVEVLLGSALRRPTTLQTGTLVCFCCR